MALSTENKNQKNMNKIHSLKPRQRRFGKGAALFGCLLLAFILAACSSVKTNVNKGSIKARTFSFLDTGAQPLPAYAEERREAHEMVQQAITKNLTARGVAFTPSHGDVTVAYLIVVGNNSTTTSLNRYFGYTDDSAALVDKVHSEQTGGEARGYFEAGTLVIDIVDPATSKLLQRRSIKAQVLRDLPRETRTARLQGLVDQALSDLPLSP
jgi:hypothetical protein